MSANIQLKGDRDLARRLEALDRKTQNKILRPAVTSACRPVVRAAKGNVGVRPGGTRNLEASIDSKVKTGKQTVFGVVGPRSDKRGTRIDLFGRTVPERPGAIGHLIEDGTAPHLIMLGRRKNKAWMHPGSPASHFMARAWAGTQSQAMTIIEGKIRSGLEKHA